MNQQAEKSSVTFRMHHSMNQQAGILNEISLLHYSMNPLAGKLCVSLFLLRS
jgi:hypothetical protein